MTKATELYSRISNFTYDKLCDDTKIEERMLRPFDELKHGELYFAGGGPAFIIPILTVRSYQDRITIDAFICMQRANWFQQNIDVEYADEFFLLDSSVYMNAPTAESRRKDYCYNCNTDELYCQAMAFKCSKCHAVILGGC